MKSYALAKVTSGIIPSLKKVPVLAFDTLSQEIQVYLTLKHLIAFLDT